MGIGVGLLLARRLLRIFSTLKMKAVRSFETSVNFHRTTQRYVTDIKISNLDYSFVYCYFAPYHILFILTP
jgi:hypothetical protein